MIPLYTETDAPKILGMPMNQNRLSVPTWSYAMEVHPPARIIELGSYNGGFTIALGVHAWNIGAKVHSFDVMEAPSEAFKPLSDFLGISFYRGDLFLLQGHISALIGGPGVSYVLCDNGDKQKEFNLFSKFLKPGDVIAAHDYSCPGYWKDTNGEISIEDVQASIVAHNLKHWMQVYFDLTGWLVFKKT